MAHADSLVYLAALWLLAAASPGPNFVLTVQNALGNGRPTALSAVAGIASGTCVWGVAGLCGVHALFVLAPSLFLAIKIVGGLYFVGSAR